MNYTLEMTGVLGTQSIVTTIMDAFENWITPVINRQSSVGDMKLKHRMSKIGETLQ